MTTWWQELPPPQPEPKPVKEPPPLIVLSAEKICTEELCTRRRVWTEKYQELRISLLRTLYIALDAGLTTDKDPEKEAESQFLSLARAPGLDIVGADVYAVAVHHAKLAGILALSLRSAWGDPWKPVEPIPLPKGRTWHSALYGTNDGNLRRVALVDHWSDDRKKQEIWGWRTLGEVCAVNKKILISAITIGQARDRHRYSPWTRCHQAPHTNVFRFKRKTSTEGFSPNWKQAWREDCEVTTEQWLTRMKEDGCMADLVHAVEVPVPFNREAYLAEMSRLSQQMARPAAELPPMRLAGCFGFSPCVFRTTCHDAWNPPDPELHGFKLR